MFGDQRVSHLISAAVGGSFLSRQLTFRSSLDVLYDGRLQSFPFFLSFVCLFCSKREREREKIADASPLWAWPLSDCFPLRGDGAGFVVCVVMRTEEL